MPLFAPVPVLTKLPIPAHVRLFIMLATALLTYGSTPSLFAETSASQFDEGWKLLRQYQFAQAQHAFTPENSDTRNPPDRITRLGRAMATLNHPALKVKARESSLAELNELWNTRGNTPDEVGLWAGYSLGRWSQTYHSPADFDQALSWYEQTAASGEVAYVAQLARLKAAGLWLYAPLKTNPERQIRLARASAMKTMIPDRGIRMCYLLILIDGMLLHRADHQSVLALLEEVWALELPPGQPRAKTLCQMGTLASLSGHPEKAIRYYRQFLSEFPIDIRTQLVRDRLAELTGSNAEDPS